MADTVTVKNTEYKNHYDRNSGVYTLYADEFIGSWLTSKEYVRYYLKNYDINETHVVATSSGGDPVVAMAVGAMLSNHKSRVVGDIEASIASATTVLLTVACDHIKMSDTALYRIHKIKARYHDWITGEEMISEGKNVLIFEDMMIKAYVNRTGQTEDFIRELMRKDEAFTAEQALQWGFVDEVYKTTGNRKNSTQTQNKVSETTYTINELISRFNENKTVLMNLAEDYNIIIPKKMAEVKDTKLKAKVETKDKKVTTKTPPKTETKNNKTTVAVDVDSKPTIEDVAPEWANAIVTQLKSIATELKATQEENQELKTKVTELENSSAEKPTYTGGGQPPIDMKSAPVSWRNSLKLVTDEKTKQVHITKPQNMLNGVELEYLKKFKRSSYHAYLKGEYINACCPDTFEPLKAKVNMDALVAEFGECTIEMVQEMLMPMFLTEMAPNIKVTFGHQKGREYANALMEVGEVLQPCGSEFNPKGDVSFKPFKTKVRCFRANFEFCQQEWYESYFNYLASGCYDPWDFPFMQFVITKLIEALFRDNRNITMWFGEYNEAGTGAVDAYDGFHTLIDNTLTAANIIATGPFDINTDNAVDWVETFVAGFPQQWYGRRVDINIPLWLSDRYLQDYREKYQGQCCHTSSPDGPGHFNALPIFNRPNWQLIPTQQMGVGQRLVATLSGVLEFKAGCNFGAGDSIEVQKHYYHTAWMIDVVGSSALGTNDCRYILVNDQLGEIYEGALNNESCEPVSP